MPVAPAKVVPAAAPVPFPSALPFDILEDIVPFVSEHKVLLRLRLVERGMRNIVDPVVFRTALITQSIASVARLSSYFDFPSIASHVRTIHYTASTGKEECESTLPPLTKNAQAQLAYFFERLTCFPCLDSLAFHFCIQLNWFYRLPIFLAFDSIRKNPPALIRSFACSGIMGKYTHISILPHCLFASLKEIRYVAPNDYGHLPKKLSDLGLFTRIIPETILEPSSQTLVNLDLTYEQMGLFPDFISLGIRFPRLRRLSLTRAVFLASHFMPFIRERGPLLHTIFFWACAFDVSDLRDAVNP